MIAENIRSRSGFSSLRAFNLWSRVYRSPSGSLKIDFLSARSGRPIQLYFDRLLLCMFSRLSKI